MGMEQRLPLNQFEKDWMEATYIKQHLKRRSILKAFLLGTFATYGLTDQVSGDLRGRTSTRVLRLDECSSWYPHIRPAETFLVAGGLGCVNSYPHAQAIGIKALGLPEAKIGVSYLVSSNQGKTADEVAQIISEETKLCDSLSYYGQSNGGPTILEALHLLKEKQGKVVPIKRLILNCSPYDLSDAKEGFLKLFLGQLLIASGYQPGEVSKFVVELMRCSDFDRRNIIGSISRTTRAIKDSWYQANEGELFRPMAADFDLLCTVRLDKYDFSGIVTNDTEILHLKSQNDKVVYNDQAGEKYAKLAKRYGAKFSSLTMQSGIPHADSPAASDYARSWLNRTKL